MHIHNKHSIQRINCALESIGYTRMKSETSIYFTLPPSPYGLSIVGTISDDFGIVAKDKATVAKIKGKLSEVWTITDKGPLKWMLNLRFRRDRKRGLLKIDQTAYIEGV